MASSLQSVIELLPILPCSRHRPVAVVDGSLTENLNEIGVRLWTDCPFVATLVEDCGLRWICRRVTLARRGAASVKAFQS